jgi:5,10-methylenetetrahydromethanopterin reductase
VLSGDDVTLSLRTVIRRRLVLTGGSLRSLPAAEKAAIIADLRRARPWAAPDGVRPVLAAGYPAAEVTAALAHLERGGLLGKIVLDLTRWRNGRPLTDPVTTLREYVESIRALLTGERVTYRGEVVQLDDVGLNFTPVRSDIPIWIAAASRRGLVNAATLGDGVLLDAGTSPEYSANAVELLRRSCEKIDRDPAELTVAQLVNTSIEDDRETAVAAIRWEVATKFTYASTAKAKMSVGEPTIDPDDLPRFAAAYERGGKAALQEILPQRYVTSLTATGTADDVRARIAAYRQAGVTLPLVRPAAPHQLDRLLRTFGRPEAG